MLIEPFQLVGFSTRSVAPPEEDFLSSDFWFEAWRSILPCLPHFKQAPGNNSLESNLDWSSLNPASCFVWQPTTLGMPYTPPSHRSPASSAPSSPDVSRRSSFHGTGSVNGGSPAASSPRPALPRSASYLTKHRRTPSANVSTSPSVSHSSMEITPPGTSLNLKAMVATQHMPVRQSPPPITDARSMPVGAIISPPDSQTSSEDEGAESALTRGRQIENLKELKDAISAIPQHRASSPDGNSSASPGDLLVLPQQRDHLADAAQANLKLDTAQTGQRRILHNRSKTEPNLMAVAKSASETSAASDDSELDEPPFKPQMVRKKSGELVRPALRPAAYRRPSSMPGTPTFSKAVHFDSHLEHVRHFLQVDRPLAVSAGSSPADNYESDTEYPFDDKSTTKSPPFEWELVLANFPGESLLRKSLPARVERVWMSSDQKSLIGSIAIANLAFQKHVVCRFTFDYWKTTSEVGAEYTHEIRPRESDGGHDRFQFTIKLSDMANLEAKTLFFCIKYTVNGLEYWDNNNNLNFQVDFRKKMLPQNGKGNFKGASSRPLNSLPRSNRRSSPSASPRPKSMPVGSLDEFGHDGKFISFDQPIHEYLGEPEPTMLRLKSSKSTTALPSDNLANRLSTPSGLAFANRYDFGVSLNAAKQAHKESKGSPRGDGLYMKPNKKASFATQPGLTKEAPSGPPVPSIVASKVPGTDSPIMSSASYEEIVNKYCFFNGSKQTSPQIKDGTLQSGRYDGPHDGFFTRGTNSTNSSLDGSPDMMSAKSHGGLHYTLHQNLSPYFQNQHIAVGASPAESPLGGPTTAVRHTLSPAPVIKADTPTPAPMTAGFSPLAGTSPSVTVDAAPFMVQDRFPFATEAHSRPAIRG
ncbi:hypothetical protein PFICI_12045 [Pestalotiopsis fici W106-1]|uniref:CBM21 domain-containing protein n=1 Tax=Pestalotiopsis fici (strain W106-1 / CGMCC3.15140) TaxID=1229662 RepID=W3WS37_PESFW|nr:uncharacterized protein PFICI_12045 [Pestalotiopsis fici W106-1]ETS76658.1 hypothetical protein PFICI_12045 [Pestalotiopsis fici W106-1]